MNTKKQILLSTGIVVVAAAFVAIRLYAGQAAASQPAMAGHDPMAMSAKADSSNPVKLSAEGARRIGVTYATVEHRPLPVSLTTVGTVTYDETRLATVNPKISGWVEKLYVDFTGAPVKAGQPLMDVYSPALVSAQEELVLAARLVRTAGQGQGAEDAHDLLQAARRRLEYWDIPESEIRRIEASGTPTKTLTLRAPASGIVVEKNVVEGDRIMPGMTVFRIADLSRVWIEADVFEKDLALVKDGQKADVSFEAYPGKVYPGRVSYVYPTVSIQDRTAHVRLALANPNLDLKPGMYAEVTLDVPPGPPTLVVPTSAVLNTGERALVFVQQPNGELMPTEVTMGRTSGNLQELLAGVEPGQRVVSSAAFLVDAESNLGSMAMPGMDMSGGKGAAGAMDSTHPKHR
jgi:multidrug efflux pump subunit AcrA (membrane-fusion protein)